MSERTFTINIIRDGKYYGAWVDEVPGAFGQGDTPEAAKLSAKKAIQEILQDRRVLRPKAQTIMKKRVRVKV